MAERIEFLIPRNLSRTGGPMLEALLLVVQREGFEVVRSAAYQGVSRWLVMYGVGAPAHALARAEHLARGGSALLWDQGYFGKAKIGGYLRASVNTDHPPQYLDATAPVPSRWAVFDTQLKEGWDPRGPIILVGLGPKTRTYLGAESEHWEARKLAELQTRFPGRQIIYRPKPRRSYPELPCETDALSPITELLRGASLVVCRHSNVAIDAVVAGVRYECEDGAARWLASRAFTRENRLDFLRRLAWWQWRAIEAAEAWAFLRDFFMPGCPSPAFTGDEACVET